MELAWHIVTAGADEEFEISLTVCLKNIVDVDLEYLGLPRIVEFPILMLACSSVSQLYATTLWLC